MASRVGRGSHRPAESIAYSREGVSGSFEWRFRSSPRGLADALAGGAPQSLHAARRSDHPCRRGRHGAQRSVCAHGPQLAGETSQSRGSQLPLRGRPLVTAPVLAAVSVRTAPATPPPRTLSNAELRAQRCEGALRTAMAAAFVATRADEPVKSPTASRFTRRPRGPSSRSWPWQRARCGQQGCRGTEARPLSS